MKKLTAFLPVHSCTILALAFGVSACAPGAESGEGPFLLQQPTFPGEKIVSPPSVWVEAVFVEADESVVGELEEALGFKLSPVDGKVILNGEEKEKLLAFVKENERAGIISTVAVVTTSGREAQSEDVEQVIFPAEYDTETIQVGNSERITNLIPGEVFMVTPGKWEAKGVGTTLSVTPTVSRDGKTITLALMPEVTQLVDWVNYGNDVYPIFQPIFRSWSKTATITIPDGSSFVFKELPRTSLKPECRELRGSFAPREGGGQAAEITEGASSRPEEEIQRPDLESALQAWEQKEATLRGEVREAEQKLAQMKKKFTLDSQNRPIQFQLREFCMQEKGSVSAQIARLTAYVNLLSGMSADERVNAMLDNPGVYQLSAEIARQEAELSGLLEEYGEEHPVIKSQKKRIGSLEEHLHGLVNGALESKKAELAAFQEEEKELDQVIKAMDREIVEIEQELPEVKARKLELEAKRAALTKLEGEAPVLAGEWGPKVKRQRPVEEPSPQKQEILRKLNTILPTVEFDGAPLTEIIEILSQQTGVNLVIDPAVFQGAQGERTRDTGIRVSLKNVPLKEVLKYILRYRNLKYLVEDFAVAVVPIDFVPPESVETEIFRFPAVPSADEGEPPVGDTLEDFLRQSGIPCPEGSNLTFDRKTGTLIVTNTPENLQVIRDSFVLHVPGPPMEKVKEHREILLTIFSAKIIEYQ
jgi:hypothetical protein